MSTYRQGTVLGLTVAETFILLAFLLLIALLGFAPPDDEPQICAVDVGTKTFVWNPESSTVGSPQEWVRPSEIETLVGSAEQARKEKSDAEQALAVAERELEQANQRAEESRKAEEQARRDLDTLGSERDQAQRDLDVFRRKGENPPCWYQIVAAGQGRTREKAYYAFNVAIYEDSIALARRSAPPGGAHDDKEGPNAGKLYADEWKRLNIDQLPYGKALSDDEFTDAVRDMVAQGKNRQVRSYECVFSVMVWDKTPVYAKDRWKDAHDRLIEGRFSAYTAQDLEWKGID